MSKTVLFQFSINIQFSSIWPISRTRSSATTSDHGGPGSDGNEWLLHIPLSSSITGTSPSDCFVSYQDTCWQGRSYPFAVIQSVYSIAPADRSIISDVLPWTLHIHVPVMAEQQELIYIIYVVTLVAVWKTYRERWMIGTDGEREREIQGNQCCQRDLMMMIDWLVIGWCILRFQPTGT